MKKLLLLFLASCLVVAVQAQNTSPAAEVILQKYDEQSIRLLVEGESYRQGDQTHASGIFYQKLRGKLASDSANALLSKSVVAQRRGFWNGMGGAVVTGAGMGLLFSTPTGLIFLTGGLVWYGVGIRQANRGTEQLHHALWLHNREVVRQAAVSNELP